MPRRIERIEALLQRAPQAGKGLPSVSNVALKQGYDMILKHGAFTLFSGTLVALGPLGTALGLGRLVDPIN